MKAASPRLEILEDRHLLSVIEGAAGVRLHLPAGGAADLSARVPGNPADNGSTSGIRLRSGAVHVMEDGLSVVTPPSSAKSISEAAIASAEQGKAEVNSSPAGVGEDVALPVAQGISSGGNSVATSILNGAARAAASADLSLSDESSQLGQGAGSSASSPFGQGAAVDAQVTFALPFVADRPRDAADSAAATDVESSPASGLATVKDARVTVAVLNLPGRTLAMTSDASPAIPADRSHASSSSLRLNEGGKGRPGNVATADTGTSPQEQPFASCGADLLASFLPFDRARVEQAIDQILNRLDDLDTGLSRLGTTANLIPGLTATAVTIAVMEIFHRWLGNRSAWDRRGAYALEGSNGAGNDDADACFPGLPGLPHQWGLEER